MNIINYNLNLSTAHGKTKDAFAYAYAVVVDSCHGADTSGAQVCVIEILIRNGSDR